MLAPSDSAGGLLQSSAVLMLRNSDSNCRGVVYEALARYDDAVVDYKAVLKAAPNDPSGWNNLVNSDPTVIHNQSLLLQLTNFRMIFSPPSF